MAKAICILKMVDTAAERGRPDVPGSLSWVHCGSVELPGKWKAFIVTGTAAQLTALSNHANFLVGQQIPRSGEMDVWEDARTAIAAGARTRINTWLAANGYPQMTPQSTLLDLIRLWQQTAFEMCGAGSGGVLMRRTIWWCVIIGTWITLAGCAPPYCVPRPVRNHAPVCRWWECPALHQAAF